MPLRPSTPQLTVFTCALFALALFASACGSRARDDVRGGESHFLTSCESTCGGGLSCIDEQCTRECTKRADCSDLAGDAVCLGAGDEATCNVASAAHCEEGGRHYALNEGWLCANGCSCRCEEQGVVTLAIPCREVPAPVDGCEYDGQTYEVGNEWTCSGGCNTCTCLEDGSIAATNQACAPVECVYEGETYAAGDEWTCSDGCNTCTCHEDGAVSTTDQACAPVECVYEGETYAAGDEWTCSDGCNDCSCLEGGAVAETERACGTCYRNGQEYQMGDVVEFEDGATCTCIDENLLGACSGVVDDTGQSEPSTTTAPADAGPTLSDRERCALPPDSGDCLAAEPAIYFDASSGQCLQFIYGGCGGNANRFDSLSACYDACGGDAF